MIIVGLSLKGPSETGKNQEGPIARHLHSSISISEKQERLNIIQNLFRKAVAINDFECRTKEKTGNKPTVFINFYGHVSEFEISCVSSGWASGVGADEQVNIYLNASREKFMGSCSAADRMLDRILEKMPSE